MGSLCRKLLEIELTRIYVRSLYRWAVAQTLAGFFCGLAVLWAVACKLLETELARIYVRSLCHWAVAPKLVRSFSGLAVLGAVASCWKLSSRVRSLAAPLRYRLQDFFAGSLCYRGGCKLLETELARI